MKSGNKVFDRSYRQIGDVSKPYPQYVFKRIEHGIAKATNITSWMKYEVSKKKKKNKKRRK